MCLEKLFFYRFFNIAFHSREHLMRFWDGAGFGRAKFDDPRQAAATSVLRVRKFLVERTMCLFKRMMMMSNTDMRLRDLLPLPFIKSISFRPQLCCLQTNRGNSGTLKDYSDTFDTANDFFSSRFSSLSREPCGGDWNCIWALSDAAWNFFQVILTSSISCQTA